MPGSSISHVTVNKDDEDNFKISLDGLATARNIRENFRTLRDCQLQQFRIREL
jgi:hypothetical protein